MGISRRHATTLVAVMLLLTQAGPVTANNFGSDWNHTCDATDASQCIGWWTNGYQEFGLHSVEANQAAATRYACTSIYNPVADLECVEPPTFPVFGVDVYDESYFSQWFAWTQCSSGATKQGSIADHTLSCMPQQLRYDLSHSTAYDTLNERRKIACHEFGHSYGLRHSTVAGDGTATCMTTVATQSTIVGISAHDTSHLNGYYQ